MIIDMWADIFFGFLNGLFAWPLLVLHIFGVLSQYPVYDIARDGGWYQFGFLIGAGSPVLGFIRRK